MSIALNSTRPAGKEQFLVLLSLEDSLDYGAFMAVTTCRVHVSGHMLLVGLEAPSFVHATLTEASFQYWKMG